MKRLLSNLLICALLITLVGLSSCRREDSQDANQDRIFTIYDMHYNANTNVTEVKATFRLGGHLSSKLQLSEGSSITFNGEELSFHSIYAYYEKEIDGYVEEGTFKFVDLNGNVYTNTVTNEIVEFPQDMDDIVKGESYEFEWNGLALVDKETVTFTLKDVADKIHIESVYDANANSIIVANDETEDYAVGPCIVSLKRSYSTSNLNAPSVGGEISISYMGKKVSVDVID